MPLARSALTMSFSLGNARMVEAIARLPAPIATSEIRPKRSWRVRARVRARGEGEG